MAPDPVRDEFWGGFAGNGRRGFPGVGGGEPAEGGCEGTVQLPYLCCQTLQRNSVCDPARRNGPRLDSPPLKTTYPLPPFDQKILRGTIESEANQ